MLNWLKKRKPKSNIDDNALNALLKELSAFGPPSIYSNTPEMPTAFDLVISTESEYLKNHPSDPYPQYYIATNLHEILKDKNIKPKVIIHPAFYELPKLKQVELFHWAVISRLTKRITDSNEAAKDAALFAKFYASQKNVE